jgi:hypothetical protein
MVEGTKMNSIPDSWKHVISRAMIVLGAGIVLGFVLYQFLVFIPTMKAFQFTMSSITIGIMYAALKGQSIRNGFAALFVWYVILTGLIEEFNSWLLILNLAYIGGMAGATFVHQRVVKTRLIHGAIQRVAVAGVIMAIANGLIVICLATFSWKVAISHAARIVETVYYNLQLGALIGLATGLGMELAEHLNGRFLDLHSELELDKSATNGVAT